MFTTPIRPIITTSVNYNRSKIFNIKKCLLIFIYANNFIRLTPSKTCIPIPIFSFLLVTLQIICVCFKLR